MNKRKGSNKQQQKQSRLADHKQHSKVEKVDHKANPSKKR